MRYVYLVLVFLLLSSCSLPLYARPDMVDATRLVYTNQSFTNGLIINLTGCDAIVKNCVFSGRGLKVTGTGGLIVEDCVFLDADRTAILVSITGRVIIVRSFLRNDMTKPPTHKYSGIAIHGAGSGFISDVFVADFPGNAFLLEATQDIGGVQLTRVTSQRCGGGMWFFDARNCIVDGFRSYDSDYIPHPDHELGLVFPCVIDEVMVDGTRVRGNTRFYSVDCQ